MQQPWSIYLLAIFMLGLDSKLVGQAFQPEFAEPLMNLTVPIGRDATFRCLVQNLGGYRVGWVKADTKAIQAIHVHVITNNHRVGVSHNGQTVWNLHIRNVQEEDRGQYMCQINTDPMKSQMGHLEVVIPPDFIPEETSGDVMVPEGGTARVSCRARGMPTPRIMWRREDGADIVIRDSNGGKTKVQVYEEEVLTLIKISRSDMGAYLCIASNGIPPSVSKRITIKVHFHPVIQVPNQLVGAPLGTDVTLECYVESSPKSINYWVRDSKYRASRVYKCGTYKVLVLDIISLPDMVCTEALFSPLGGRCAGVRPWGAGEMVISSMKYEVENTMISSFENRMALTVRRLSSADVGGYKCVAKNSLGEVDSVIRLYEIPGPTIKNTTPTARKEDYKYSTPFEGPEQFGSADVSDDEDDRESATELEKLTNKQINSTRNRTSYAPTISIHDQKLSNKVRKIINKFEIDGVLGANSSFVSSSILVYMPSIVFVSIYILGLT